MMNAIITSSAIILIHMIYMLLTNNVFTFININATLPVIGKYYVCQQGNVVSIINCGFMVFV